MIRTCAPGDASQMAVFEFVLGVLRTSSSFIDVGCGDGKYARSILAVRPHMSAWIIDAHKPNLDGILAHKKIHGILPEALRDVPDLAVDAAICLDVIEHLKKEGAVELIRGLDRIVRQVIVLFTPLGFMAQPPTPDNPYQEHRCGFEPEELEALGYETTVWKDFDYGKRTGVPDEENILRDALWGVKWP